MIRALLRLLLILIVIAVVAGYLMGYRISGPGRPGTVEHPIGTIGTTPSTPIDTERARSAGEAIGEKVAAGANEAGRVMSDTALTTKIKSKMALDDTVEASRVEVHTTNGVVSLTGTVRSEAEHAKAVQLAKETRGVT